jgi:hypothetical protein
MKAASKHLSWLMDFWQGWLCCYTFISYHLDNSEETAQKYCFVLFCRILKMVHDIWIHWHYGLFSHHLFWNLTHCCILETCLVLVSSGVHRQKQMLLHNSLLKLFTLWAFSIICIRIHWIQIPVCVDGMFIRGVFWFLTYKLCFSCGEFFISNENWSLNLLSIYYTQLNHFLKVTFWPCDDIVLVQILTLFWTEVMPLTCSL